MTTFEQVKREAAMRHEKAQGGRASESLTLRDYFASKALQGICASGPSSTWLNADLARESYEIADAMLKARES